MKGVNLDGGKENGTGREKELISVEDAHRAAERFILGRHTNAKVSFDKAVLKAVGTEPVYECEGKFSAGSGIFSSGAKKLFKIQVHAYSAKVVGYEM